MTIMRRQVSARKIVGKKVIKNKVYTYEYYTLPLNLYLPKGMVEKWGTDFILERNDNDGVIIIKAKKAYTSNT